MTNNTKDSAMKVAPPSRKVARWYVARTSAAGNQMNLCVVDGTPGMTMPEAHEKALELAQEEPGGDFIYYPVRIGVGMASKVEEVHRTVKTEFLGVEA